MDAEHLSALRQAATALISTAAAPTVLAALQALLADPAFATEAPALPLQPARSAPARTPVLPAPHLARDKPASRVKPAATPSDPAWDELRSSVRQAMVERGLDYAGVAQAIGRSATAVRIEISSRKPPRPSAQARLRTWLEQAAASEGAAPIPFRHDRTERGNHSSGAYVDSGIYVDSLSAAD